MAVSSCKSYDETTSWRSEESVINLTNSAPSAGDYFVNKQLDKNCNNNNSKNKEFCSVSTNLYLNGKKDLEYSEVSHIKLLEKRQVEILSLANLSNCHNNLNISENCEQFTDQEESKNTMKLLEVPVNCDTNIPKTKSESVSPEIRSEIDTTEDVPMILREKEQYPTVSVAQQVTVQTVEVSQPSSHQSNVDEDEQSVTNEEEEVRDPEWIEERFRVDRRKLEQMLQAPEGSAMSGEAFFSKVMAESGTVITWPSKLKIGAKSKKDPHIKVSGKQENVKKARVLVMQVLDTKCTRVTLKMDVSHTEHSHVIGKGGYNIKRVMEDTECHIHFPDSNRNSAAEKSNQVSIAGQSQGVESAMNRIRELLPIVITFDLSLSGSIPDPNSPPIQQIVQTYNVSVQFKQRAKAYCTTTCTVRGSKDNVTGIVEGTLKLMQHLTGGQILRVTSQLEVAQQQHSYMLGRNACNVKHIMQKTGAQISFPDPSIPKKNTIFISGSVEQVVVAREKLMGCLPLVLMFDMKQDDSMNPGDESAMLSRLMESLDIFISVKLKPKQPSKSVIVKSIERNIYNMFEARRQLLKLPSTGVKTPPSSSPTPLKSASSLPVTPVIRLPQSQSPHIKPQYIGIIQSNGVALVNGSMSPLNPSATPTGSTVLRPNWPHSPLPSPSQSPFQLSQQATVAAIHAQQQHNMLLQAHLNIQQQQQLALASSSQPSSVVNSPPHQMKADDLPLSADPLQVTQQFIQENLIRNAQQPNSNQPQINQVNQNKFERGQIPMKGSTSAPDFSDQWASNCESEDPSSFKYNSTDSQDIPGNVRGLQRQVLAVQMGRLSANNSFNKGSNPEKPLTHAHSFSDSNALQKEEYASLHHRLSLTEGIEAKNLLQVSSNFKRGAGLSRRSTPTGSDRNSPLTAAEYQALSPENDLSKQPGRLIKSPSSSSSSCDLQAAFRNLHTSSNRASILQADRLPAVARLDGSFRNEKPEPDPKSEFFQTDSPAPPPGFDNFPLSRHSPLTDSSYETMRQKAYEAMQKGPVASEIRTPTNIWFGQGFSRSMPSHEWNRSDNKKFKNRLDTNYEREDSSLDENADSSPPSNNHLTMSQRLSNSTRGSSAFLSWREKNSHSLSSHTKDMVAAMPKRRQHSTFDPQPGEYMNQSIPPPPHPNDDSTPPPSFNPSPEPSNQPLVNALSLLTNLGGRSNCIELQDLLNHLNLQKYSEVFVKQEVDLQTFLTLTDSDLMELGISAFGPRRKILLAIEELKKNRNLLYGKTLNAAPGGPTPLPPQQSEAMGAFLQGQSNSPNMRLRPNLSQQPSSRLLNGGRGIVSQSGRW